MSGDRRAFGALAVASSLTAPLPVSVLLVRGYLACFSEFFELPKRRLALASAGAVVLSAVLSPVLPIPGMLLFFRLQPALDLIF